MRKKLIETRKKRGFTQNTIAKELGVSRGAYACYESGFCSPSLEVAIKIKQILKYEKDDIFLNSNVS